MPGYSPPEGDIEGWDQGLSFACGYLWMERESASDRWTDREKEAPPLAELGGMVRRQWNKAL